MSSFAAFGLEHCCMGLRALGSAIGYTLAPRPASELTARLAALAN